MIKTSVIIAFLVVLCGTVLFVWSRAKRQQINSFWDVVRNPDAMPDLDEYHREVDEAASALSGTPAQVAQLVDRFVFEAKSSADEWTELRILAQLGEEAYPRALEILRDPSLTERLSLLTDDEEASLPRGPINRLCKIFDQDAAPPEEAALLLAPFLQSESDEIRKSMALIIGSIASDGSLPDLRRALSDENQYVRSQRSNTTEGRCNCRRSCEKRRIPSASKMVVGIALRTKTWIDCYSNTTWRTSKAATKQTPVAIAASRSRLNSQTTITARESHKQFAMGISGKPK